MHAYVMSFSANVCMGEQCLQTVGPEAPQPAMETLPDETLAGIIQMAAAGQDPLFLIAVAPTVCRRWRALVRAFCVINHLGGPQRLMRLAARRVSRVVQFTDLPSPLACLCLGDQPLIAELKNFGLSAIDSSKTRCLEKIGWGDAGAGTKIDSLTFGQGVAVLGSTLDPVITQHLRSLVVNHFQINPAIVELASSRCKLLHTIDFNSGRIKREDLAVIASSLVSLRHLGLRDLDEFDSAALEELSLPRLPNLEVLEIAQLHNGMDPRGRGFQMLLLTEIVAAVRGRKCLRRLRIDQPEPDFAALGACLRDHTPNLDTFVCILPTGDASYRYTGRIDRAFLAAVAQLTQLRTLVFNDGTQFNSGIVGRLAAKDVAVLCGHPHLSFLAVNFSDNPFAPHGYYNQPPGARYPDPNPNPVDDVIARLIKECPCMGGTSVKSIDNVSTGPKFFQACADKKITHLSCCLSVHNQNPRLRDLPDALFANLRVLTLTSKFEVIGKQVDVISRLCAHAPCLGVLNIPMSDAPGGALSPAVVAISQLPRLTHVYLDYCSYNHGHVSAGNHTGAILHQLATAPRLERAAVKGNLRAEAGHGFGGFFSDATKPFPRFDLIDHYVCAEIISNTRGHRHRATGEACRATMCDTVGAGHIEPFGVEGSGRCMTVARPVGGSGNYDACRCFVLARQGYAVGRLGGSAAD